MIQRIQSLFLLLAALGSFALYLLPFAATPQAVPANDIFADSVYNLMDHIGLIVFFSLAGLLALVAIFLYSNRRLQMRLTIFAVVAIVVGIAFGIVYFVNNSTGLNDVQIADQAGVYLPVLSLIFALLAYRYINKDEKMVQSMDRLR